MNLSFFVVFCAFVAYVFSVNIVNTYFNQHYALNFDKPGEYKITPSDYKRAPTIFVAIYGGGGGGSMPYRSTLTCTGQNGGYIVLLLDTHFGKRHYTIFVGKGGKSESDNITKCDANNNPVYGTQIPSTDGESSYIESDIDEIKAESKGGKGGVLSWVNTDNSIDRICVIDFPERGGYTNITFARGVHVLERQDGENSHFYTYGLSKNTPGYGGRGMQFKTIDFPCKAACGAGNNGTDGLVLVTPIAVSVYALLHEINIVSVDINYYMR